MHSLYQDLFITDLKSELEQNNSEIQELRLVLQEKELENEELRKQNRSLKNIVTSYRRSLVEAESRATNAGKVDRSKSSITRKGADQEFIDVVKPLTDQTPSKYMRRKGLSNLFQVEGKNNPRASNVTDVMVSAALSRKKTMGGPQVEVPNMEHVHSVCRPLVSASTLK